LSGKISYNTIFSRYTVFFIFYIVFGCWNLYQWNKEFKRFFSAYLERFDIDIPIPMEG